MKPRRGQTFNCEKCSAEFYRSQSYIAHVGKPRYCSQSCFTAACKSGEFTRSGPRPNRQLGQTLQCMICNADFYRRPSYISRGISKTCGKRECISESMRRENNPFWGKDHSPEVREALSEARVARESSRPRRYGPLPGAFKHTPETRAKMSEMVRERWRTNRDKMMAHLQTIPKVREDQRYRKNFTPFQRRTWKTDKCAWCATSEDLVLDHIIPVMDGGHNLKENAQTLCQPCNIWKSVYVDRPSHLARLALQGGLVEG